MEVERADVPEAAPQALDWRKLPPEHRAELYSEVNMKDCEILKEGETAEVGSVHVLLVEIRQRLEIKPPEVMLIPPSLAVTFSNPKMGIVKDSGARC